MANNIVNQSTTTNFVTVTFRDKNPSSTDVNLTSPNQIEVRSLIGPTGASGITQDTGSLLVTASYSNPNLTFTKGDGTTFSAVISTDTPTLAQVTAQGSSTTTAITASIISASGDVIFGNITGSAVSSSGTGSFGYITTEEYIAHKGDQNTAIRFTNNKISLDAGGMTFFAVHDDDSAPFTATVNGGSNRINFKAMDKNNKLLLKTDSDEGKVNLYYSGSEKLSTAADGVNITGNITASGNISSSGTLTTNIISASDSHFGTLSTTINDNILTGHITASGNISSSNTVQGLTGSFTELKTDQYIYHNGDLDTLINFTDDRIRFNAGGINLFGMHKKADAPHQVTVNNGGNNVSFVVKDNDDEFLLKTFADTGERNVKLYQNGNEKLSTSADGVGVIGNISASGDLRASTLVISRSANFGGSATFGSANNVDVVKITGSVEITGSKGIIVTTSGPTDTITLTSNSEGGIVTAAKNLTLKSSGVFVSSSITASGNISASGNLLGGGLNINGPSNSHVEVGTYNVGFDQYDLPEALETQITGSGLIISGNMADQNHHNMIKIGDIELVDVNTYTTENQFLIHNAKSFKISSGSDGGNITTEGRLIEHDGTTFKLYSENVQKLAIGSITTTFDNTNVEFKANAFFRAPIALPTSNGYFLYTISSPSAAAVQTKAVQVGDMFKVLTGAVTASAVSASGTSSFAQISLPDLPTSDPGIAGRLFTTQSTGTGGNLDGQKILLVSQG